MEDIVDLDTPLTFLPSEWIGQGKTYNPSKLHYVVQACTRATEIPSTYKKKLPLPSLSVTDFLSISLPPPSSSIITLKVEHWFSTDPPDENFTYLHSRPFPPIDTVHSLSKAFGQAWLDGTQSVINPRYNNGHDRLPLWILSFWREQALANAEMCIMEALMLFCKRHKAQGEMDVED